MSVPLQGSLFISSLCEIHVDSSMCTGILLKYTLTDPEAACAMPYIGTVRGLWEGDCLVEHGRPLARPLGMPSGHIAHASPRGDTWIHYYLVMDFTINNNQTISDRDRNLGTQYLS